MPHTTVIGVEILCEVDYGTLDFYNIDSPVKGYGGKMVDSLFKDFPADWSLVVIMD